jgi:glutamine synthetase
MLSLAKLKKAVIDGEIDCVLVAFPDIYGRLMGKRFDGEYFIEEVCSKGSHACDYLLSCDMNMNPIQGFSFSNWEKGYGDFHFVPDLSSLRRMSWHQSSAMVIADVFDPKKHHSNHSNHSNTDVDNSHMLLQYAPRSILR